ncbi:MAG: hypothetical protein IPO41_04090 [Acidobacteria bacterium]|nr:hypothetical protein [Acidobacteriota bacterium]MBK9527499.1 hypothetical protein [Acidobacteriota bacterium]MBP9108883.1 hypothetical protein [Pyrinomonadaceae bacterium]
MRYILSIFVVIAAFAASVTAQDLKPDEIIAKHLDSIGKKEARESLKTLMAVGTSEFESRIPLVKGGGKAIVVSDPGNLFFIISLNSKEYPFEKIGHFNGKTSLPFISAGNRSLLGTFLKEHDKILSSGLFTGSMSLRWFLADADRHGARLKSAGMKTVDGKKLHALDCFLSGSGSDDFKVRLYFDDTFRHVRTEYKREVVRGQGTFGQANQQANARVELTEVFSDFKTVADLTLPYTYRVTFSSNSNSTTNENMWGVNVTEYYLNQKLQPDFFTFDSK